MEHWLNTLYPQVLNSFWNRMAHFTDHFACHDAILNAKWPKENTGRVSDGAAFGAESR
jgi:hypothetical protein